jgi:hypothetical protein
MKVFSSIFSQIKFYILEITLTLFMFTVWVMESDKDLYAKGEPGTELSTQCSLILKYMIATCIAFDVFKMLLEFIIYTFC